MTEETEQMNHRRNKVESGVARELIYTVFVVELLNNLRGDAGHEAPQDTGIQQASTPPLKRSPALRHQAKRLVHTHGVYSHGERFSFHIRICL